MKKQKHTSVFRRFKTRTYISFGLALILFPIFIFSLFRPTNTEAVWMDDTWKYRTTLSFIHNATVTDTKVKFDIDTQTLISAGKMQSDCGDSRFTDVNGKVLPYYIDSVGGACNTNSTDYYVLIPTIQNGGNTLYHYYGNPSATDGTQLSQFAQSTTSPSGVTITTGSEEKGTAPVLYLGFNEGYGTTTNDGTKGGNNGTLSNGPIWKDQSMCFSDKCISFDGSNDIVTVTQNSPINLSNGLSGGFTIETWIHPNGAGEGTGGQIFFKGTNTWMKVTNLSSGVLDVSASVDLATTDATVTASAKVSDNQWAQVALSYTDDADDEIIIWVNGIAVATSTNGVGSLASDSNNLVIGGTTTNNFAGLIDEFKIYSTEKTASQMIVEAKRNTTTDFSANSAGSVDSRKFLSDGLVGYWKLDEASGITKDCTASPFTDSSGNNNNGKSCPSTTGPDGGAIGKFGNAVSLDGSNDYIEIPSATVLHPGDTFTLSAWVKRSGTGTFDAILGTGTDDFQLAFVNDNLKLSRQSTSDVFVSTSTYTDTTSWHHIVATKNGGTSAAIYFDGVQIAGTYTNQTIVAGTSSIYIGGDSNAGDIFAGSIDDVRIYNRSLSADEVRSLYNWAPRPVGYWKLDEGSSTSAFDVSTNGNTGTLGSALSWKQGKFGKAVNFPTAGGTCVSVGSGTNISNLSSLTISAWIYPTGEGSDSGIGRIVGKDPGYSFLVGDTAPVNTTNGLTFTKGYATTELKVQSADNVWTPNTWQFVTVTWSGSTNAASSVKMYVNGVETAYQTQQNGVGSLSSDSNGLAIGAFSSPSCNFADFEGVIDEVKIYNYPRSNSQIVEDMNAGHPLGGSPVGSQVAYWRMGEANGTTAHDSTNNGNSLTLSTASWSVAGKTNGAWNGVGTNWLTKADDSDFDFSATDDFSISMWFKSSSASNPGSNEFLMSKVSGSSQGYAVWALTSGHICFGIDDDSSFGPDVSSCSADDFYDANWHHVIGVRNTNTDTVDIYIDGKLRDSQNDPTTATLANSLALYVGDFEGVDNGSEWNGLIDEVKVYRSALTKDQIAIDYNAGSVLNFGSTAASEASQLTDTGGTAPIGYWNFDEKTGTTAKDLSGNGRDAALTNFNFDNNSGWTQGKYGSALHYDGSNDVTQVTSASAFSLVGSGNFTIESWVRIDALSAAVNQRILTNESVAADTGYHFALINSADGTCASRFIFEVDKAATYHSSGCSTSNSAAVINTWYHLVGVFNGTTNTATLYINGIPQVAGSTKSLGLGVHLRLTWASQSTAGTNVFDGQIDETKIYDYARSQSQIMYDYNRANPIGLWRFDACQGATANDASGYGNNATLAGTSGSNTGNGTCSAVDSATKWYNGRNGKFNSSLSFDGTDDTVTVTDTSNLRFDSSTQDFSLFAWVKRAATGSEMDIISKEDADNDGYRLEFTSGDKVRCSANSTDVDSTNTITDTNWHLIGCTLNRSGNGQVYIDGRVDGTATAVSSITMATTANIVFGARSYTTANYFNGLIDDVRIYNYSLSLSQIQKIYNGGGSVNFGPASGQP